MTRTVIRKRPRATTFNIVGISAGYHDSACCLLQDGQLVAAAQEERFTRVKNDKSFPRHSFRYCLDQGGISIADIDCIAFYEDTVQKLGRQLWMGMTPGAPAERRQEIVQSTWRAQPTETIRTLFGYAGPIEIVDHHLSHAASAFFYSGFEEAAILTLDGVGDWPTTTYGSGTSSGIERVEQVDFPHSLGFFYSAITSYLGFKVNEGEYKVMGLAPYGEPRYADRIRSLIALGEDGQYRLDMKYFGFLTQDCMYSEELVALLGMAPRERDSELLQFHKDVARSAQVVLEDVLLEKVRYLHRRVPSENLCLAGGVALNVVANGRCLRDGPFERLFVAPAAGDAGGSVGAAAVTHLRMTGERPDRRKLTHVYLGPHGSSEATHRLLRRTTSRFLDFRGREKELVEHVVGRLVDGKVVGWARGRMEFGPRSLGTRSILADPRRPEMRDKINALIKMRESFRPFAPAVLEAHTQAHFDLDHASPFMLETCRVISSIPLPAITHVDGSARVQTVSHETNPAFAALLEAFYRRTDCPILLNTSFNMSGEPIVNTSLDAISCFVRSKIDILVVDDFVLDRQSIPALWEMPQAMTTTQAPASGEAVEHLVYTLL